MLALLIAVLLQAAPAFPENDPYAAMGDIVGLPPPWDYVEIGQWHYVAPSNGNQTVVFVRPGPRTGLVWARYEYLSPTRGLGARSTRILHALDCQEWKSRRVQQVSFDQPNLLGIQVEQSAAGTWEYAGPDTVADAVLRYGCRD